MPDTYQSKKELYEDLVRLRREYEKGTLERVVEKVRPIMQGAGKRALEVGKVLGYYATIPISISSKGAKKLGEKLSLGSVETKFLIGGGATATLLGIGGCKIGDEPEFKVIGIIIGGMVALFTLFISAMMYTDRQYRSHTKKYSRRKETKREPIEYTETQKELIENTIESIMLEAHNILGDYQRASLYREAAGIAENAGMYELAINVLVNGASSILGDYQRASLYREALKMAEKADPKQIGKQKPLELEHEIKEIEDILNR